MAQKDWHDCTFLESGENLKPLVKRRFGREPSTSVARDITACLQQGRLFYEAASTSPLEIRPLQQFYGMVGFCKALTLAHKCERLATLPQRHGLKDISVAGCGISDLRVEILKEGTFQRFNDVIAQFSRVCYIDTATFSRSISIPSAQSDKFSGVQVSLREIVSRVPGLESIYRLTFGEDAGTAPIQIHQTRGDDTRFQIGISVAERFTDARSLRAIVARVRTHFPFLGQWKLHGAQIKSGYSSIAFRNTRTCGVDEFADGRLSAQQGGFFEADLQGDDISPIPLKEGLSPLADGFSGRTYAISPIAESYLSEFAHHYLALFLLSSLVRYRPETWTHAISHSITQENRADDKALSLIGHFLELNSSLIPLMVTRVLNPNEDSFVDATE